MHRIEDHALLTGRGRFIDDRSMKDQLEMAVLRSDLAHGQITELDVSDARAMPGVHAVLTIDELDALGIGPLRSRAPVTGVDGAPMIEPERPILARERALYPGQPIAAVIAEDAYIAADALEAIVLDIDALPAVASVDSAAQPDAHQIWEFAPGNRSFSWEKGNAPETSEAFAQAAHVVELTVRHPRIAISPIEPRGCLAHFDPTSERFTLITPSQGVFALRAALSACLGVEEDCLRVITEDVGGSFAAKIWPYPEHVLALVATRLTGRPVKWIATRTESLMTDAMGRGRVDRAALALDAEGRFLGFRIDALADMGAFLNTVAPFIVTTGAIRPFGQCYAIPAQHYRVSAMFTNAVPTDAYRGAGKPESTTTLERLIDVAAERLGRDRLALRRQNLLTPADMPHETPMGETMDGGDFPALAARISEASDWDGLPARKAAAIVRGRRLGAGVGFHLHATGGSTTEQSRVEAHPDGTVSVYTGSQDSGQGHKSTLALVAAEALEIPIETVRVTQGDSDVLAPGGGTGGSNLLPVAANTVHRSALLMLDNARSTAAEMLEVTERDLSYGAGQFTIVGTDRALTLAQIAGRPPSTPDADDPGCVGASAFEGIHTTFPNGAYACEVELDPETGEVQVCSFVGVDDIGRVFYPASALGQIHGGIAQALGEVMMEAVRSDADGQPLSASFMDYALPRAIDTPVFDISLSGTASPNALLGAKGVGELSSIGAPGVLMNAIIDAAGPGAAGLDRPLTSEVLWRASKADDKA